METYEQTVARLEKGLQRKDLTREEREIIEGGIKRMHREIEQGEREYNRDYSYGWDEGNRV